MLDIETGINFVKFAATWCSPCKMIAKNIDKIKTEFPEVKFQEVDVDDDPDIAKNYKIKSVPTVIVFKDNEEIIRLIGAVKIDALRKAVRDIVNDSNS